MKGFVLRKGGRGSLSLFPPRPGPPTNQHPTVRGNGQACQYLQNRGFSCARPWCWRAAPRCAAGREVKSPVSCPFFQLHLLTYGNGLSCRIVPLASEMPGCTALVVTSFQCAACSPQESYSMVLSPYSFTHRTLALAMQRHLFASMSICVQPLSFISRRNLPSRAAALAALAPRVARLADIDTRRASRGVVLGGIDDALLDVGGQVVKGLVDVDVALSRDFEEGNAELLSQGLALFGRDGALLLPVALVANQNLVDALCGVLLYVCEPGADIYLQCPVSIAQPEIFLLICGDHVLGGLIWARKRCSKQATSRKAKDVLSNDRWSVTSYTSKIPIAPR